MSKRLDIAYTTLIAELLDRALDAQFDQDFDETGAFVKVPVEGRDYWYFNRSTKGGRAPSRTYVGPADDEQITDRVLNFGRIKSDYRARRRLVSTLVREARLPSPDDRTGDIVDALWKGGLFRLRACLVGTIAFQNYGAYLGHRLGGAAMQTGDIDIAQFHSISVAVEDTIPPILELLQAVDKSFYAAATLNDRLGSSRFVAADGLRVEFLTPNTGSSERDGKPTEMPALGGAAAEPLRFLDFLIRDPVRTVMLHKGGIPILIPDPSRYAVHKLIVAARRAESGKSDKDLMQAQQLIEALNAVGRRDDLVAMREEALERGDSWRDAIDKSLKRMKSTGMSKAVDLFSTA